MKLKQLLNLFLIPLLFSTCIDDNFTEMDLKPDATGEPGKIVVVLDKEYWDTEVGKAIKETLQKPVETLPQEEPLFDVLIVDNISFIGSLRTNHTILIFNISNSKKSVSLNFNDPKKDVWAKGQVIYKISGNVKEVAEQYKRYSTNLSNELATSAISVLQKEYKDKHHKAIKEELEITMDISLDVPTTMTLSENFNDFIWMQQVKLKHSDGLEHEIQQGLVVYSYPFIDDSTFTLEYQIAKRDSMMKKYIEGVKAGTYMTTERSLGFEPQFIEKEFKEEYAFEMKGLWKMKNSLMGGPFISVSRLDKAKNRIITVEGYIFAPKFQKQLYLRELEAMVYSLEF